MKHIIPLSAIFLFVLGSHSFVCSQSIFGFNPENSEKELAPELDAQITPANLDTWMKELTSPSP